MRGIVAPRTRAPASLAALTLALAVAGLASPLGCQLLVSVADPADASAGPDAASSDGCAGDVCAAADAMATSPESGAPSDASEETSTCDGGPCGTTCTLEAGCWDAGPCTDASAPDYCRTSFLPTCVNLKTDLDNCGACGLVCSAAPSPSCSGGWCNYTIASGSAGSSGSLTVDSTSLYWGGLSEGTVEKMPIASGDPTTLATVAPGSVHTFLRAIAVDGSSVYFAVGDAIMKVALDGGPPATVASGQEQPVAIAVDATSVYWVNYGGAIMKAPLGDGGPPAALVDAGLDDPVGIALDTTSVYWAETGAVMKVPVGGGSPTTLADAGADGLFGIAVDSTSVYWTNQNGGTVMKAPLDGGAPTTLASGQDHPAKVVVDATSVYWTNQYGGTVMKVPLDGGTPTTLASEQTYPYGIAVDATSVYWANQGGSVMKAPK